MIAEAATRRVLFVGGDGEAIHRARHAMRGVRERWRVESEPGGAEALERLDRAACDIVVVDMQALGLDGAALFAAVAERHPRVMRLALSERVDREMAIETAGLCHQLVVKSRDMRRASVTVARVLHFRDLLEHAPAMQALVSRTAALPVLPETYEALLNALGLSDSSACLDRVARIARRDAALAAGLLRLARWVGPVRARKACGIEDAVESLGVEFIRGILYSTQLIREWPRTVLEQLDIRAVSRRSVACGVIAGRIARTLSPDARCAEDASVAGLLHEVGMLVLAAGCPPEYEVVLDEHRETGEPLQVLENKMFGADHALVGGALLTLWGFPRAIAQAVAWHHRPEYSGRASLVPLVAVHAANDVLLRKSWVSRRMDAVCT